MTNWTSLSKRTVTLNFPYHLTWSPSTPTPSPLCWWWARMGSWKRRRSSKQSRTKKGLRLTRCRHHPRHLWDHHRQLHHHLYNLHQERWLWVGGGEGRGEIYKSRETRGGILGHFIWKHPFHFKFSENFSLFPGRRLNINQCHQPPLKQQSKVKGKRKSRNQF